MELYLVCNLDDWEKTDIFDYVREADNLISLLKESKKKEAEFTSLNNENKIAL